MYVVWPNKNNLIGHPMNETVFSFTAIFVVSYIAFDIILAEKKENKKKCKQFRDQLANYNDNLHPIFEGYVLTELYNTNSLSNYMPY